MSYFQISFILKPADVNLIDRAVAMVMMRRSTIKPCEEKDFWELEELGVAPPYSIKLKIDVKQFFDLENNLAWDNDITERMKEVLTEAMKEELLKFPRKTKTTNATGSPIFVGFSDGALQAYDSNVYDRLETKA